MVEEGIKKSEYLPEDEGIDFPHFPKPKGMVGAAADGKILGGSRVGLEKEERDEEGEVWPAWPFT